MTKLLVLTAIAAVVASPALAASKRGAWHAAAPMPAYGQHVWPPAYARAPYGARVISPTSVYRSGQYLGSDPDPNVRLQILRDADSYRE